MEIIRESVLIPFKELKIQKIWFNGMSDSEFIVFDSNNDLVGSFNSFIDLKEWIKQFSKLYE